MEVVDLRVFDHEGAPEAAPHEAQDILLPLALEAVFEVDDLASELGWQSPLGHLVVGGGGQVDPPQGGKAVGVLARRDGLHPVAVLLQGGEEALHPALLPAVLVGARPEAELLPVVPHDGDLPPALARLFPQVLHHLFDGPPGNAVAQPFAGAEDLEGEPLLLGDVIAEEVLVLQAHVFEVGVVHDSVLDPRLGQGFGEVGFPHPFGQPEPHRIVAEVVPHRLGELFDLAKLVHVGNGDEDGLVVAASHDLHLAPAHQRRDAGEEVGAVLHNPVAEAARVVEGHADGGVLLQQGDHGLVGFLVGFGEDEVEVAHGLVVVDGQAKIDVFRHGILLRSS